MVQRLVVAKTNYQQKQIIRAHKTEGYLQLNQCAQHIAYHLRHIATVDMQTLTMSL